MDTRSQVAAAREGALVVPRTELATLVVTGNDRVSWLNGLLTCDLVKRPAGAAVYGLAVGRNGRVLCDATVVFDDARERLLVALPDGRRAAELRTHLDHYLVMEDAEVTIGESFGGWAVHGPRAGDVLAVAVRAGACGGSLDATGLGGAFVLAPADRSTDVAGALAGVVGVVMGDDAAWEALRLERAVPRFGADFGAETYPQEAGLEKAAVSFDKGCYLGQEVVCMLELRGHVKRKLVAVVLDAPAPPEPGARVTDSAGAEVGAVTSAALSPTLGKPVALAMVKRALAAPGTGVLVGGAPAKVVERPA